MGSALQERQESHYEISTEGDREAESEIESLPCPLSGGVGRTAPEKAAFQWILKDGCALPPQRQEGGLLPRGAVMKLQRTQASPFSYCSALSRFITAASTSPSPSPLKTPISSPLRFSPRLSQTPCRPPASIRRYPGPSASCCRTVLAPSSCCVTSCVASPHWTPGAGGRVPRVPPGPVALHGDAAPPRLPGAPAPS